METLPVIGHLGKAKFINVGEVELSENEEETGRKVSDMLKRQQLQSQLKLKKKELPNYMKPNKSWLNRDKNTNKDGNEENGNLMNKSSKNPFFPSIYDIKQYQKPKKTFVEGLGELNEEGLNQLVKGSTRNVVNKLFVINKEDFYIQDMFKKICQEKKDSNIIRAKVTKGKMKAYLSKKYKGKIAEKILFHLDFSLPMDFNGYIEMLERMMNS